MEPRDKPLFGEKKQLRIDEMFAFVATDENGNEGLPAFLDISRPMPMWMPMIGADMTRIASLEKYALTIKEKTGQKIKLVKFTNRQDVRDI